MIHLNNRFEIIKEHSGRLLNRYPIFILQGGYFEYDFKHTVFGQIFEGMDVVEELVNVELNELSQPIEDIVIEEIEIVPFGE